MVDSPVASLSFLEPGFQTANIFVTGNEPVSEDRSSHATTSFESNAVANSGVFHFSFPVEGSDGMLPVSFPTSITSLGSSTGFPLIPSDFATTDDTFFQNDVPLIATESLEIMPRRSADTMSHDPVPPLGYMESEQPQRKRARYSTLRRLLTSSARARAPGNNRFGSRGRTRCELCRRHRQAVVS